MVKKNKKQYLILQSLEDNISMNLKYTGINARNWVDWAQDRDYSRALENPALDLRAPKAI